MSKMIVSLIRLYQRTAPKQLRESCRFKPSCSEYMILSLEKYGNVKGFLKGIIRIFRCNPFFKGGVDYP